MAKNESSLLAKLISLIIILAIIAGILLTWRFFAFTYDVEYTRSSVEVVWASEEDKNNLGDIYSEDYLNENFPSDYSMRFAKEENICYISTAEEKDQELNYKKFENVISVYRTVPVLGAVTTHMDMVADGNKIVERLPIVGSSESYIRVVYSKQFKDFLNFGAVFKSF